MNPVLPRSSFYNIRDPEKFYSAMRRDVALLISHSAYTSCTTLVLCCIDALAANGGETDRGKFTNFVARKQRREGSGLTLLTFERFPR